MAVTNDVFVSYRRKNVDFVKRVVAQLEANGKSVWVDWDDIPPGVTSFTEEIERGIDGSHIFLAVLSPDYLESEHCIAELKRAADFNKRIIPIVYEKFENYPIPKQIQVINWVYFTPHAGHNNDFETAFAYTLQAINADYSYIQEHTRLLQRATDWDKNLRNDSFLLTGDELNKAEGWLSAAANKDPAPALLHTDFILASRRDQSKRQRRLLVGTSVLLALAVIALIVAVQQFLVADRRADETLSLLIANDAQSAAILNEPMTALSRAYYANTFLDNPPDAAQSVLQTIAVQPAPRYIISENIPDIPFILPMDVDTQIPINDTLYLQQDSETELSIRDADGNVQTNFTVLMTQSRDDSLIHPDVRTALQDIQNNSVSFSNIGYDISPDEQWVATSREGSGLVIYQNIAGAPIFNSYDQHSILIDNVQFTADGRYLISKASGIHNPLYTFSAVEYFIWDTSTWQVVERITNFDNTYDLRAISEDGRLLIFADLQSDRLIIWDSVNGALEWKNQIFDFVRDLDFTPDGEHLIVSSVFTIRQAPPDDIGVFDPTTGEEITSYRGLDNNWLWLMPLMQGHDYDSLSVIDQSGVVSQMNIMTGEHEAISTLSDISGVTSISENGRFIAYYASSSEELVTYDMVAASEVGRFSAAGFHQQGSISHDGRFVSSVLDDVATIIDVTDGSELRRYEDISIGNVVGWQSVLFTDDNHFFYADASYSIHVIDTETWDETAQLTGFLEPIYDMEYSAEQNRLAVGGTNGTVIVWDTNTGRIDFQLDNLGNSVIVGLSPNGNNLVTANEVGEIRYWNMLTAEEALAWVEENRALLPLSCADRLRYGLGACE